MFDPERMALVEKSLYEYRGSGRVVTEQDTLETVYSRDERCRLLITAAEFETEPTLIYNFGINSLSDAHVQLPPSELNTFVDYLKDPGGDTHLHLPGYFHYAPGTECVDFWRDQIVLSIKPLSIGGKTGVSLQIEQHNAGGVVELTPAQREHLINVGDRLTTVNSFTDLTTGFTTVDSDGLESSTSDP